MSSTTILPHIIADYDSAPAFVDKTYGEPLFRTDTEVHALAYADDDTLWSIEEGGVLRQWAADGRLLARHFLSDLETTWAFNHDATLLASGSDNVTIWNVINGNSRHQLECDSWVMTLDFSHDGKTLVSGHEDGSIHMWDAFSGKLLAKWDAHRKSVSAFSFHYENDKLASAGEDCLIHIWDLATRKALKTLKGHSDRIPALAWHPSGDILISAGWDTTARVWDTTTAEPLMLLNSHSDQVHTLAYSKDGKTLAVADSDFAIHIWQDPRAGRVQFVLQGHTEEIRALAFSNDGTRLASAGVDRVVHLWDVQEGRLVAGPSPRARHGIALVNGESLISTAGSTIQGWEQESAEAAWVPQGEAVLSVATSPDGKRLATSGQAPEIKLWNLETHTLDATLQHTRGPIVNLTFSPDSQMLASASVTDGLVWVWKMGVPEAILVIPEAAESSTLEALAFHPTMNWLAVGGLDWLATGGSDGALCLWDLDARDKIATVNEGVTSIAFDPSGRFIAAGTLAQTVAVWEVKDFKKVFNLPGHQDRIGSVLFSPDGSWLASASDDSTLRIWNVLNGRLVVARQFDAAIQSLAFSADGKYLYTGNGNTTCYRLELQRLFDD